MPANIIFSGVYQIRNTANDKVYIGSAKNVFKSLIDHKKLSSYPDLRNVLIEGNKVALDSPWKFSDICLQAIDTIEKMTHELEIKRKELIHDTIPNKTKGWIEDHV